MKAIKKYAQGGSNDPKKTEQRRKALQNELRIANDPKTNYASEDSRKKDISSIQARIKDLGK